MKTYHRNINVLRRDTIFTNYTLKKEEVIIALDGTGYLLEHNKSGAKLLVIKNSDENKVFNVIFRTPPHDHTGLPHILEHSVLCGSQKYPVKDPFVELAKGSLNTFLNAMTYPDKTMYPVASCNQKDFQNLMDVYLNAVFYPNIYHDERILQQEGWHYELEAMDQDVTINGVVYNEMKGASSSPEQVLFRQILASLFPNHPYSCDSGGDPDDIPNLTLNHFLDFHRKYYHPSNSYIYLYGDLEMDEKLKWLDEHYLSQFERIDVDSKIQEVPSFKEPVKVHKTYAISSNQSTENKTFLSYNVAFQSPNSLAEDLGLQVLEYLLLDAPGAPLKEALQKLKIAEDIFGSYESDLRQPTFSIVAKNTESKHEDQFISTIQETLNELVATKIPHRKIEAALNFLEFKFREADFGRYPKGLVYSINSLESWLYDKDPFGKFQYDQAFLTLRDGITKGFFEQLLKENILNNSHISILTLSPDPKMLEEKQQLLNKKLSDYTRSLSEEEKKKLIQQTKDLKDYQASVTPPKDLKKIPLLELSDIDQDALKVDYTVETFEHSELVIHKTFTNNIIYMGISFDFSAFPIHRLPYVSLLVSLLGKISTDNFSYSELSDEINIQTGGIGFDLGVFTPQDSPDSCLPTLQVSFKCFSENVPSTIKLVEEILTRSQFDNVHRIKDIILEVKSRLSMGLVSSGHISSITRSLSYHAPEGVYQEYTEGITFYQFIEKIIEDDSFMDLSKELNHTLKMLLNKKNACVLINADEKHIQETKEHLTSFIHKLPLFESNLKKPDLTYEVLNEGFKTSSKVQYCALTGNFFKEGFSYTGYMKVLQTIISLDYMWTEIRVKGGAYGGFSGFKKNGLFFLGSYRDPNLKKTFKIYHELPHYIENLNLDDREISKYIIGTLSKLDTPLTPKMKGERALGLHLSKISHVDIQRERDEILSTRLEDLTALSHLVQKVIDQKYLCVIGNEVVIDSESETFKHVIQLFK
jgi:Zn-dependent M16 (insulinase) family peptidase